MKAREQSTPAFLSGGAEMGELIRSFDWSKTSIGSPDKWPQSLRIAVRIMLDSPFGMYIAWGKDYIQLYNDGYRPILGATKHPQALGNSSRETFAEIWPTIGPMFEGVMQGIPVGFPDFTLEMDRNGFLEECVFDFSYSPIRLEHGEVGGVLVTVIETTEKVKIAKALKESEGRFQNLVREADIGIVVLSGEEMRVDVVNEAYGRLIELTPEELLGKPLFDLIPHAEEFFRPILNNVRLTGQPLYLYDQPYSVVVNGKKIEGYLNVTYQAYKEADGTISGVIALCQDITETIKNRKKLEESEEHINKERTVLYNSFMNAPAAIAILKGDRFIYEFANAEYEKVVDRKITIGKTVQELFPEIEKQGLIDLLNNVFTTGEPFIANEFPVELLDSKTGKSVLRYYNSVMQPLKDENGNTERLLSHGIEVTHQIEARKQIEESEKRFGMLADSIPNLAWMAYADGSIFWYNKQWFHYTGTTLADMEGWGWQSVHDPEELPKVLIKWRASIETGKPFEMVFPLKGADGNFRQFLTRVLPVLDSENKIYRWFGTNTDITEQKSFAEELENKVKERTNELHIQNETFKQAEESSGQGSYSFNLTTGKLAYSDNLYRLIGFEPHEFEPSLEEFNMHVHPDDREFVALSAEKILAGDNAEVWNYRIITKTGTVINIKGTGRVIESSGEKLLVGTLQDITKDVRAAEILIEKEDYLNQIISNAPDGVIVINDKNIITLWNPKTEEIFGWKSEEVLGKNLSDIIIPMQYREGHREGMKRLLRTGEPRILNKTLELTALNKGGKEFFISLTVSQAMQQGNRLFISFIRDITMEKQNKEELTVKTNLLEEINLALELKNKELENTNAELASFSYVASHDLKEPLRKIQVFSKRILETENFTDKTKDYFNRIISAGERMQNLIDSLLDLSRSNTTDLIFKTCDLNAIVEESKHDLQERINESLAIIESDDLPVIKGVYIQLCQLFTNLIDNAIKYSRSGTPPHITISASVIAGAKIDHPSADLQKEYHAIKIADNGIGFEKEYAQKIFELFQRLHLKNEYSGTGIGLAIVKKIVTNHHGFIIAEGKPNIGSTFTVYFPTT